METTNCFFCNSQALKASEDFDTIYRCKYCGEYTATASFLEDHRDIPSFQKFVNKTKHILAGYLSEIHGKRKIIIDKSNYSEILNNIDIPKTTMQKLERLLQFIYIKNRFIGQVFSLAKINGLIRPKHSYDLVGDAKRIGIAYSRDSEELTGMLIAISELGWIDPTFHGKDMLSFFLTAKGLSYAENMLTTNANSNKVFIAMAFQENCKEKCEKAIKPACKRCGFDAQKVDDEHYNGSIIDRIIVKIKRSKFVIADYTYDNSGAYYEAGYADGMGLHVIECCEKAWFDNPDNKVHLDKRNNNLILYADYKNLEEQLVERIRATIPGAILEDK